MIDTRKTPTGHGTEMASAAAKLGPSICEISMEDCAAADAAGMFVDICHSKAPLHPIAWNAATGDRRSVMKVISKRIPEFTNSNGDAAAFFFGIGFERCAKYFERDDVCNAFEALGQLILRNQKSGRAVTEAREIYEIVQKHLVVHESMHDWIAAGCKPLEDLS